MSVSTRNSVHIEDGDILVLELVNDNGLLTVLQMRARFALQVAEALTTAANSAGWWAGDTRSTPVFRNREEEGL